MIHIVNTSSILKHKFKFCIWNNLTRVNSLPDDTTSKYHVILIILFMHRPLMIILNNNQKYHMMKLTTDTKNHTSNKVLSI